MNRAFLLALGLGIGVMTGCAMQTASGDPSTTGEESGEHEGASTPATSLDSDPLSEGTTIATPGQAHVAEYHGGVVPTGDINPLVVRGDCPTCAMDMDNTQPIPWALKAPPKTPTPAR